VHTVNWGVLDVLVNNAALMDQANPTQQLFEASTPQEWRSMLRMSLEGTILTLQHAVPFMRISGWGRVVNVS
jgi:NAD(P)-dependent dehydrogenase (short-subunit alcohol dehydrogenase family)